MKGKRTLVIGGILVAFTVVVLIASWAMMFVVRAQGVSEGFEAALVRTYEMGRPIPDGQYVRGAYRIEATHVSKGARKVDIKVRVLENRTGAPLALSTGSVEATY